MVTGATLHRCPIIPVRQNHVEKLVLFTRIIPYSLQSSTDIIINDPESPPTFSGPQRVPSIGESNLERQEPFTEHQRIWQTFWNNVQTRSDKVHFCLIFRRNITHIDLVTERSVGAILELALVVCGVADSEASQGCGEVPLGWTIIQTETPTATWKHRCVTKGLLTFMLNCICAAGWWLNIKNWDHYCLKAALNKCDSRF